MKLARFILKIVGAALALASLVCLVVGFWDKVVSLCPTCAKKRHYSEYDDYADLD